MYFWYFILISPSENGIALLVEQIWVPFTQGCFWGSLVKIGWKVLQKKTRMLNFKTKTDNDKFQTKKLTWAYGKCEQMWAEKWHLSKHEREVLSIYTAGKYRDCLIRSLFRIIHEAMCTQTCTMWGGSCIFVSLYTSWHTLWVTSLSEIPPSAVGTVPWIRHLQWPNHSFPCAVEHPVVKHLDAWYYLNQSTVHF